MAEQFNITDEISPLKSVILGRADSNGPTPTPEQCYDPKSLEHVKAGTYPKEADMVKEMAAFEKVLKKYGVKVYRPDLLENVNQIFTRDIGFVIDDTFIKANILPDREQEFQAITNILSHFDQNKIVQPPEEVHIEGGDVMPWDDYIFVGTYRRPDYPDYITARTNAAAVDFLKQLFPNKKVVAFDLKKSNTDPRENALHLDCVFQPVGNGKAIIHKEGFLDENQYQFLVDLFGKDNMLHINKDEMYDMAANVFSISPKVVVSEQNNKRLNNWLRQQGLTVKEVPYKEIAKQEGLLRCSTLPLQRS
ncbi:MAG TPA: amidinotransferase [Flavobacteriales bacterium]|nr:amidinotransferase [Flavobacteriales bacterium]